MPRARPSRYEVVLVGWCLCHFDFVLGVQSVSGTPREQAVGRVGEKLAECLSYLEDIIPQEISLVLGNSLNACKHLRQNRQRPPCVGKPSPVAWCRNRESSNVTGARAAPGLCLHLAPTYATHFCFVSAAVYRSSPGVHCIGWHVGARP